jgi:tetraprenyl-beta-curcumene synthase
MRRMDRAFVSAMRRYLISVLPHARAQLRHLHRLAGRIPDAGLRRQALASLRDKDFHVYGGCILATFLPARQARAYIELVAAFETAVDYLDNLCDRAGEFGEADYRALHESLEDAVAPRASPRDYFRRRSGDDGGYLNQLVLRSQRLFRRLPAFAAVQPWMADVTRRYCELQALKHLKPEVRERRCREAFGGICPDLQWWEAAAACGSTLPTFALVFAAMKDCSTEQAMHVYRTYFPLISGLHILLDYFIDQAEDQTHNELNFVACYGGRNYARAGLERMAARALGAARQASEPQPHVFAVQAMCGFYCTRPAVAAQGLREDAAAIASAAGLDLGGLRTSKRGVLAWLLGAYERRTKPSRSAPRVV